MLTTRIEDPLVIFTVFSTNRRVYSFSINDVKDWQIIKISPESVSHKLNSNAKNLKVFIGQNFISGYTPVPFNWASAEA